MIKDFLGNQVKFDENTYLFYKSFEKSGLTLIYNKQLARVVNNSIQYFRDFIFNFPKKEVIFLNKDKLDYNYSNLLVSGSRLYENTKIRSLY